MDFLFNLFNRSAIFNLQEWLFKFCNICMYWSILWKNSIYQHSENLKSASLSYMTTKLCPEEWSGGGRGMARWGRTVCAWLSLLAGYRGVTHLKCWRKEKFWRGGIREGECLEINSSVLDENNVVLFLMYSCFVSEEFFKFLLVKKNAFVAGNLCESEGEI